MRRFIACNAIAALLVALVYAPLFHLHIAGEYEKGVPLLHAHFPEPEPIYVEHSVAPHHPESITRSIDVLTAMAVHSFQFSAVITDVFVRFDAGRVCCGFVALDVPRAHAPPLVESRTSRAPPA
jgi:hypothetical protein